MPTIRERNKRLIIKTACQVFADKGFAATKTSEIADKAGLPKANIYYYFKSKEALYRAVLDSVIEPLLQANSHIYEQDEPARALQDYIRAKIRISREHADASKVFANEIMHGAPHLSPQHREQLKAEANASVARIQGWVDDGRMAPVDPQHLMFVIWASTQTYADFDWQIMQITGRKKLAAQDYDAAAKLITDMVLKGCEVVPCEA
ncbi:transcriptional regulator [Marinobacterium nitratireducens]|uniref:Transcriptional regulator n=1 Tax=Marinobacterium nitratireducens TaxID=518897 RepID=A0A917ZRR7_9GAMM|nr:TetR/AcrR family transcriptional regulator [Marinobacterium nitratireducens]GGO88369.1 transcriptional regulator [Marinobacterium nitratireducens]